MVYETLLRLHKKHWKTAEHKNQETGCEKDKFHIKTKNGFLKPSYFVIKNFMSKQESAYDFLLDFLTY